jgi:cyclic pyranopterin phosphate synthase
VQTYKMINVGDKDPTRRTCLATGKLIASPEIIQRIKNGELPKGNVLPLAEAAGIIAVKKTSDILPLCHPLPIDAAYVSFKFEPEAVQVFCEVTAFAKTGVEMEALNGVNAALLCIYDLTKGIFPALELSGIHLVRKEGGKSGVWTHPKSAPESSAVVSEPVLAWSGIRVSVITLSDRGSQGLAEDTSGPKIVEYAKGLGATLAHHQLIPDNANMLKEAIQQFTREKKTDLVICTGGTGLGPRDITPETIQSMGGKIVPGIGELIRKQGANFTPYSWLSRSEGFLLDQMLIICLPGSFKAVCESLDAVAGIVSHAKQMIRGDSH